jgi:hypothetical protein
MLPEPLRVAETVTARWVAVATGLVFQATVTSLAEAVTTGAETVTLTPAVVRAALTAFVTPLSVSIVPKAVAVKAADEVSDG